MSLEVGQVGSPITPMRKRGQGLADSGTRHGGVVLCSMGIAVQVLIVPDIFGVPEIGDVELTASREDLIPSQQRMHRDDSLSDLTSTFLEYAKPKVVVSVANLGERHGMLPGRMGFLRFLASIYGYSILLDTQLKWVPVTQPPGDLVHYRKQAIVDRMQTENRVLIAFRVRVRRGV